MKKFLMTAAAACFALGSVAHAGTILSSDSDVIKVTTFNIDDFNSAIYAPGGNFQVQDFEDVYGDGSQVAGQLTGSLSTNVGTFSSAGGIGSGDTCQDSLGNPTPKGTCDKLYLKSDDANGQDNTVPLGGDWTLNSNDTTGIIWNVVMGDAGALFNRVVFAAMDFADQNASVTVTAAGETATFSGLEDSNAQLIVIDFATRVGSATITMVNNNGAVNDAFSIDGGAVGVVPVPAGGLLLLTGLGALAMRRRRKAA